MKPSYATESIGTNASSKSLDSNKQQQTVEEKAQEV